MDEADWERLIDQLQSGHCTPFLGAGACAGILPSGEDLSRRWAKAYKYPFAGDHDLARVMQFAATSAGDDIYLKELVCQSFSSAAPPSFTNPSEPHALLASFPIPVFLTTNYDDFLVQALRSAGKKPNAALCPWSPGVEYDRDFFASPAGLNPDPVHPLVYHLHGSMHMPKSLVLTENDYLEFLVRIASSGETHQDESPITPTAVLSALTDNPLLFIGYSLQDWTFRVIFHGLLSPIPGIHRRRSISVQLLPPVEGSDAAVRARQYLTRYMENWRISIFWGTASEFCSELRHRVGL